MSYSLQIGLAATGGVVLAGLVLHNVLQARKARPRKAEPETATPLHETADAGAIVPGEAERQEPLLDDAATLAADEAATPITLQVPVHQERRLMLDPLLDALAPILLDEGALVSGDAALSALPATRRVDNKPFAVEGRLKDSGEWEYPQPGHLYNGFQAGVQLANRSGALNDIGFSEFTLKAQDFADAINGSARIPDMRNEVHRARELDQFAASHDARLHFVLRARQAAWSIGYLQQTVARHGFVPGALPGRLVLPSATEGAAPLLSLEYDTQAALAEDLEQSAIYETLLGLEVTHVPAEERPFARMCEIALQLAEDMGGNVTDGNGIRIMPESMEKIAQELEGLYQELDAHGFPAGSDLARRLFS